MRLPNIVRSGIAEQASMQLMGIKGVLALQDFSDCDYSGGEDEAMVTAAAARGDKYLVQSFAYETRVLAVDAEEGMSECEIPGLANAYFNCWLWDYLRRSGASGFLLPLSVRR